MNTPWVEKYRPKNIQEICHQNHIKDLLQHVVETGQLPHLLFYGPPGTGKTSSILALARQLFTPEGCKSRVLELNASQERGIDMIRQRVKEFSQARLVDVPSRLMDVPNHHYANCPSYKLIILDEADSMTKDAQGALKRIMEKYANLTRFAILCNYKSHIIEPIVSRCAQYRFDPLDGNALIERLNVIRSLENITIENEHDTYNDLMQLSGGDLRRAINLLQVAYQLSEHGQVTSQLLHLVAGEVPKPFVQTICKTIMTCASNKSTICPLIPIVDRMVDEAHDPMQLLKQLLRVLLHKANEQQSYWSRAMQGKWAIWIAESEYNLGQGVDEKIEFLSLLSKIVGSISSVSSVNS